MPELSPAQLLYHALDLDQKGKQDEAQWLVREAIRLKGNWPEAHVTLGVLLFNQRKYDLAIAEYHKALALNPNLIIAYNNLGYALLELGRIEESIRALEAALRICPAYVVARTNLGVAKRELGLLDQAEALQRDALTIDPQCELAHNNLAAVLLDQGKTPEAIEALRRTIDLHASSRASPSIKRGITTLHEADLHANLAMAYLMAGDFIRGWPEYEWRLRTKAARKQPPGQRWNGGPVGGKTILIHAEQGFGDTIQFVRYATLLASQGAQVVVECQPELAELVRSVPGVGAVVVRGQPLPAYDYHIPLLSLPLVFKTDLTSIPSAARYMSADQSRVAAWKALIAPADGTLRVGLVWAGNPKHKRDRHRSIAPAVFAETARAPGVRYYSLQKSAPHPLPVEHVIDLAPHLRDFSDTAAALECLDLLISVDTSVAHLAGALGRPVWTLIAHAPDFRWLREREDSPWYPTMRLLRQTHPAQWGDVIKRVATNLRHLAQSAHPRRSAA